MTNNMNRTFNIAFTTITDIEKVMNKLKKK